MRFVPSLLLACFLLLFPLYTVQAQSIDSGSIVVTGTVAPKPESIQFTLQSSQPNHVNQDTDITYTITVDSNHNQDMPVVIQAEWGKATIHGASEPTVFITEYIPGSATNGYANAEPIVDFLHKQITWTIPSLPANTKNMSVSFGIRTNTMYTGPKKATFPVYARILAPSGIADKSIQKTFLYLKNKDQSSPTPTPTSTPISTDQPTQTVIPDTVKVSQHPLTIGPITSKSLGAVSIKIGFSSSEPISPKLEYGERPTSFSNAITLPKQSNHTATITQLKPGTSYYFRIVSAQNDQSFVSDIYTFTTAAQISPVPSAQPQSLIVMQKRQVIFSSNATANSTDSTTEVASNAPILVTKNVVVDFQIHIPTPEKVKSAELFFQEAGVLGISTADDQVNVLQSRATKLTYSSGESFSGKLRTPVVPGTYQVMIRVEDWHGNIEEKDLGIIQVLQPFQVVDKENQKGIVRAKVSLSKFNEQTKQYDIISNVSGISENPILTNDDGIIDFSVTLGKYLAHVEASSYESQDVYFEIFADPNQSLPKVYLVRKSGISLDVSDASNAFSQFIDSLKVSTQQLLESKQFYSFMLFISLFMLLCMLIEEKIFCYKGVYHIGDVIESWAWNTHHSHTIFSFFVLFVYEIFTWLLRFYTIVWLYFGIAFMIFSDVLKGVIIIIPTLAIIALSTIHRSRFLQNARIRKCH